MIGTVLTAAGLFAGTNLDDIVVLTVLFLSSRANGRPARRHIWAGQYLGIATLVAVSALAALGLSIVPDRWVGLLGLLPLALGVRGLLRRGDGDERPVAASGLLPVAGITIANGADNLAVYTPYFRTVGVADSLVTVAIFAVLVALWCVAGSWLGSHPKVIAAMERHGHWIVPVVFIVLGLVILSDLVI